MCAIQTFQIDIFIKTTKDRGRSLHLLIQNSILSLTNHVIILAIHLIVGINIQIAFNIFININYENIHTQFTLPYKASYKLQSKFSLRLFSQETIFGNLSVDGLIDGTLRCAARGQAIPILIL